MAKDEKVTSDKDPKAPLPPDEGASPESDEDTSPESEENASPESSRVFYKHKYVNCYLTLNPAEVAEGKLSVKIHLVKDKTQEWGIFETGDEHVQALIAAYPWFGKSIVKIDEKEALKLNQPKPGSELYHRGVSSAMSRKQRK